jgi:hypothetical protein
MRNLAVLNFLIFLLISCNTKNNEVSKDFTEKYRLVVYDTLNIKNVGQYLFPISYTKDRIALTNLLSSDTIIQSDFNGNILNKFRVRGDSPETVGSTVFCMGYVDDSSIAVISNKGLFLYNLEGKLFFKFLRKNPSRLAGGIARMRRLLSFYEKNEAYILAHWIPFVDEDKFEDINVQKKLYDQTKFLTVFNIQKQTHSFAVPFEPNSIFLTENKGYNEQHLFDYNRENKKIYSLISPEKIVRVYSQDGKKLEKSIEIYPKEFILRKVHPFGSPQNQEDVNMLVNSEFRSIDVSEDGKFTLVSYQTGIPEEEYKKAKAQSEIPNIMRVFNKHYVLLLESDEQKSESILLPQDVYEVALFKSIDYILLATDSFEIPNKTTFYVARLEKVQ